MNTNVWALDTAHSGISFSVRHMVVAKVRGRFATWTGTVELDEADPTRSRVEVQTFCVLSDARCDGRSLPGPAYPDRADRPSHRGLPISGGCRTPRRTEA